MYDHISENDECCYNCEFWIINTQLYGPADGVICSKGNGHTAPDDYCNNFRVMSNQMDYLFAPGATSIKKDRRMAYFLSWLE